MLYIHGNEVMFRGTTWEHYTEAEITVFVSRRLQAAGYKAMNDTHEIGDRVFVCTPDKRIEPGRVVAGGIKGQLIEWGGKCPVTVLYAGDRERMSEHALIKWAYAYNVEVYAYVPLWEYTPTKPDAA